MLLDENQVSERLKVSARALQRWRALGVGPAFVRIGPRFVRYESSDVDAFVASGRAGSLAEERARTCGDA